jgi:hypothetical protein
MATLPEGYYEGEIKEWGFGKSSKKKTPYFEVTVLVTAGKDDAGNEVELEKAVRRSIQMYLTPRAMNMTTANIRALGYEDKDLSRLNPDNEDYFDLRNKQVLVRVQHETYEATVRDEDGNIVYDEDGKEVKEDRISEKLNLIRNRFKQARVAFDEIEGLEELNTLFGAEQTKAQEKANGAEEAPKEKPKRGGRRR